MNERVRDLIVITGSSGLIGAAVARRPAKSFSVVGFDKDGNPHLTSHVFPGDTSRGQAFLHLDDLVVLRLVVQWRKELRSDLVLLLGEPETLSYEELQRSRGRLIHGEEWETKQIERRSKWLMGARRT